MPRRSRKRAKKGAGLLIVLAVTAVAAVAGAELSWRVMVSRAIVANREAALANRAGAFSAASIARGLLIADRKENSYESLNDGWAGDAEMTAEPARVRFRIDDERGKLPLALCLGDKSTSDAQKTTEEFLAKLGLDPKGARKVLRKLARAKIPKDDGANFAARFAPLAEAYETLAELAGPAEAAFRRRVSIWTDGRLNPNTAPPEVLDAFLSILGIGADAEAIAAKAREEPYETIISLRNDLRNFSGDVTEAGAQWAVASDVFSLTVTALSDGLEQSYFYMLKRKGEKVEIIYWRRIRAARFEESDAEGSGNSD